MQNTQSDINHELGTPAGVATQVCALNPYPWQYKVYFDMEKVGAKVSLRAANGSGKTSTIALPLIVWHMCAFPGSITVVTSGTYRQVRDQLMPALRETLSRFKGWQINASDLTAPNGSYCVGFSTNDPGKFEGFHAKDHQEKPLLIMVDEAKSVEDGIFTAIDRCQPTRLLLMSSPGASAGAFFRSHTSESKFYKTHVVTAFDCPHLSQEHIQYTIDKYGEDHPFTRSSIYGEFMDDGDSGIVIPMRLIDGLRKTQINNIHAGERHAFCDFAAGGDENVLAIRNGNVVNATGQ